jgi:hypothetical protein
MGAVEREPVLQSEACPVEGRRAATRSQKLTEQRADITRDIAIAGGIFDLQVRKPMFGIKTLVTRLIRGWPVPQSSRKNGGASRGGSHNRCSCRCHR